MSRHWICNECGKDFSNLIIPHHLQLILPGKSIVEPLLDYCSARCLIKYLERMEQKDDNI